MTSLVEPLQPPPRAVRIFRFAYAVLTLQFALPAVSYLVSPTVAMQQIDTLNQLLGGRAIGATESTGHLWHMLAVGNVATLAFMCALLWADLERFYPVLPALAFLKLFSAPGHSRLRARRLPSRSAPSASCDRSLNSLARIDTCFE